MVRHSEHTLLTHPPWRALLIEVLCLLWNNCHASTGMHCADRKQAANEQHG